MIKLIKKAQLVGNEQFSILIPTWNNVDYLMLCIKSIRKNSALNHQILIHVNEGSDGTIEALKHENVTITHSDGNIGVCWALNGLRPHVDTQYMVFMNDDMYVCPGWDSVLVDEIKLLPDNMFFLSSTLIQPRPFWCKSVISPADFGQSVATFDEAKLLNEYASLPHHDWSGATWPPNVVHRDIWDLVGGYSTELSPGMYSDPDFSAKLWQVGVRYFKGLNNSRVYHFEARSTGRVRKNKGSRQFLNKWGITSSVFMSLVLHRGEPWQGELEEPLPLGNFRREIMRSSIKRWFAAFKGTGAGKPIF